MNKKIIAALVVVLVAGGAYYLLQERMEMKAYDSAAKTDMPAVVALTAPATMADVAMHTTKESCWSAIDGNVYDLTGWISMHPGGERAITSLCGKDGTAAFHAQHKDNKRQADTLAGFKIGSLAQ